MRTKRAIPEASRRAVALAAGAIPGQTVEAPCHYCGTPGNIYWHTLYGGKPSAWVSFDHELDHVIPESKGGASTPDNLVLACRFCNRSKGAR